MLTIAALALGLGTLVPAWAIQTTTTPSGGGAQWTLTGENKVKAGRSYTYTLTRTSGNRPLNEYFGFTSSTLGSTRFQGGTSNCTGTVYFCLTITNSGANHEEFAVGGVQFAGRLLGDTSPHVLTLQVGTGTPTGTTVDLGVVTGRGVRRGGELAIEVVGANTSTVESGLVSNVDEATEIGVSGTTSDMGQLFHVGDNTGG